MMILQYKEVAALQREKEANKKHIETLTNRSEDKVERRVASSRIPRSSCDLYCDNFCEHVGRKAKNQ